MTFSELKTALNNLRVDGDSDVFLCLPDAEISLAVPYLVSAEAACHPSGGFVVRIYGEEPMSEEK